MWLKQKLFKYRLNNVINHSKRNNVGDSRNASQYICILFDESQLNSVTDINFYVDLWNKKGKKVETFSYQDVSKFPDEEEGQHENQFCKQDINWFNAPKGPKIERFLKNNYDILITLNPGKKEFLHFLNAASSAKFKIGLLPDELEFYNLILDCENPNNVKKIFSDIQQTLNKLTI